VDRGQAPPHHVATSPVRRDVDGVGYDMPAAAQPRKAGLKDTSLAASEPPAQPRHQVSRPIHRGSEDRHASLQVACDPDEDLLSFVDRARSRNGEDGFDRTAPFDPEDDIPYTSLAKLRHPYDDAEDLRRIAGNPAGASGKIPGHSRVEPVRFEVPGGAGPDGSRDAADEGLAARMSHPKPDSADHALIASQPHPGSGRGVGDHDWLEHRTFSPQIVLRATTTGSAPDARTRSKQRGIPVLV